MPNIHDLVRYRFGTQSEYDQIQIKDGSTLYWITDSHRMYIGDKEYTRPVVCGVDSPEERISSAPYSLYFQETESSPIIWYNATGDPSDWEEAFAITDFMKYAPSLSSSSEVTAIPAGQIYTLQDWAYLKTGSTDYMQFLDTSKACKLVGQDATDNQYVTALALYKWNRKVVELPAGQSLPNSWSTINSYDPLGVLFVKTVSQDKKEYYICSHRDQTSTQFYQPIYIELCTYEELEELRETCMHVFENDPESSDEGVVNQVVYSIESNSLFKCTNVSGSSYTWEKMQTPVNVEWWDYVTTQDNHKEVPYNHEGNLGDIVVTTPDLPSSSHTSILGGEIWQCYKQSWSSITPDPDILYYWRKIKNGVNYLFTSDIPDVETAGEQWDITYVSVEDKIRLYQLTSITRAINPDYDPDYDDPDEQYINHYNWTRLMTHDDCVDVLHIFDTDPVSGQTSQTGTYGELNQLVYSTSSSKFFKCTSYNMISRYPFNVNVTWEEIDKVSKITYWNYTTSSQHNFNPEGEAGNLGDMIVITKRGTTSDDVTNGGSIWICYMTVFHTDTQNMEYFWREIRDGICCEYIQGEPTPLTNAKQFDLRWLGDPQVLGQQDTGFRLFQNIGTYGLGTNVWKELLTQNNILQDISSTQYQNSKVPSAYAAKDYTDNLVANYEQLPPYFNTSYGGSPEYSGGQIFWYGSDPKNLNIMDRLQSNTYYQIAMSNNITEMLRDNAETGEIDLADIYALWTDPNDGFTISGNYTLIGDMCFFRATAHLVYKDYSQDPSWQNWERVYYYIPVNPTSSSAAIARCGEEVYSISTGNGVIEIRQIGSRYITQSGIIEFTLIYKYT